MSELPTAAEFFLSVPLYRDLPYTYEDRAWIESVLYASSPLDAFCVDCGKQSIFIRDIHKGQIVDEDKSGVRAPTHAIFGSRIISFICTRQFSHRIEFWVETCNADPSVNHEPDMKGVIRKIGQYPSLADLHIGEVQKYRKLLGKDYSELTKAIGLNAHGVGIGAYSYLRRVFERLIIEAHASALSDPDWARDNEASFNQKRMEEKIRSLASVLPPIVVKNHQLYGILSKGIHELDEDDCKAYFPVVYTGICLILDDKLAAVQRQQHELELGHAVSGLHARLSKES